MNFSFTRAASGLYPLFFASLLAYVVLLLIGPQAPTETQQNYCVTNVVISDTPFGVSLNCDSFLYIEASENPESLLSPYSLIQTRPGMIFANIAAKQPFSWMNDAPDWLNVQSLNDWIPAHRVEAALDHGFPEYIGFVLINFLLLHASFLVLRLRPTAPQGETVDRPAGVALIAMAILLVTNDVTKAFFWSPHTQMFNIAVPLISVGFGLWTLKGGLFNTWQAIAAWALTAWCILSYGAGIIILAAMGVATLYRLFMMRDDRPLGSLLRYIAFSVAAVLPLILWVLFLNAHNGGIYSHEVEQYGQFVWMGNILRESGVLTLIVAWVWMLSEILELGLVQAWPAAVLLLFAIAASGSPTGFLASLRRQHIPVLMCLLTSLLAAVLYATVGFIQARLAFSLAPPLILASAFLVIDQIESSTGLRKIILTASVLAFTIGLVLWMVIKDGPYS